MLDQYELGKCLGTGGGGTVYEAYQRAVGRTVAIKFLSSISNTDPHALKRFQREARIAGSLSHNNICQIYSFGISPENGPYLVLEFLKGKTLDAILQEAGKLPFDSFAKIFTQTCDALAYAHSKGIIHRDIKPANIMLVEESDGPDPVVKLLDFGIAQNIENQLSTALTRTGIAVGTPLYMSPEHFEGSGKCDARSDIYSLGCVMYEAISGQSPFAGDAAAEVMWKHLREPPPHLAAIDSDLFLPPSLVLCINRCLSKEPASRPTSAAQVKQMLMAAEREMPISVREISAPIQRITPPHFRRKALLAGGTFVVACVAIVIGLMHHPSRVAPAEPQTELIYLERALDEADKLAMSGDFNGAENAYQELLGRADKELGGKPYSAQVSESLYRAQKHLGDLLGKKLHELPSADAYTNCLRQQIKLAPPAFGANSEQEAQAEYDLSSYLSQYQPQRIAEAADLADKSLAIRRFRYLDFGGDIELLYTRHGDSSASRYAQSLRLGAEIDLITGKSQKAMSRLKEALSICRRYLADDDAVTLWVTQRLCLASTAAKAEDPVLLSDFLSLVGQASTNLSATERQTLLMDMSTQYKKLKRPAQQKQVLQCLSKINKRRPHQ